MNVKMRVERIATPHTLNWFLGWLGLAIIWLSTHNWVAILGGVVAGIHITWKVAEPDKPQAPK